MPTMALFMSSLLTLIALHEEVRPAILRPTRLVVIGALWPLFSIADRRHSRRRDALRHEIVDRGLRTPIAECNVVLHRPALVAVTLDQDEGLLIGSKPFGIGIEDLGVAGPDRGLVEIELDIDEVANGNEFAGSGPCAHPRRGVRSSGGPWYFRVCRRRCRGDRRYPGDAGGRWRCGRDGDRSLGAADHERWDEDDHGREYRSVHRAAFLVPFRDDTLRRVGFPGLPRGRTEANVMPARLRTARPTGLQTETPSCRLRRQKRNVSAAESPQSAAPSVNPRGTAPVNFSAVIVGVLLMVLHGEIGDRHLRLRSRV